MEIKNLKGEVILEVEAPNLRGANLQEADLRGVDLRRADLRGVDLWGADLWGADLRGADLRGADLRKADLRGADLRGATLRGATLRRADLRKADLQGVDLRGADLQGADLQGALGIDPRRYNPYMTLLDQVGVMRAYKLVTDDYTGPHYRGLNYQVGREVSEKANTDPDIECSYGISLATLDWVLANWSPSQRVLLVEFDRADLAAVPYNSDGKFRVHRCKVLEEMDLVKLGLESGE